jgi:hypothetical protein
METLLCIAFAAAGVMVFGCGPRWFGRAAGLAGTRAPHPHSGSQHPSPSRHPSAVALKADGIGLQIVERQPPTGRTLTIPWSEIELVAVYKMDLYVVDAIMLGFRLADGSELEFSEEVEGWSELARGLHHYLPGCIPFHEWFMSVAFPAFQTNFTAIFKREAVSQVELNE